MLGYDFYKEAMARGFERVAELGPVLGAFIIRCLPTMSERSREAAVRRSTKCRFTMSGTEAVMQAVRLAPAITPCRSHLVRFCGAYHGWWGDVQPGIG